MSDGNIACTIGSQIGNGGGEMKFQVPSKDAPRIATCIATEIVNEILESALDLATLRSLECNTIAFSIDSDLFKFAGNDMNKEHFENSIKSNTFEEELKDELSDIKEIIEGLDSIHVPSEEPIRLDVEMKRLLNEMMSPPYDIVNYETLPRKNGVGDQTNEDVSTIEEAPLLQSDESLVDPDQTKIVEKKTRATDLIMNSKEVLSEYLMSEEARKKQEEWEVSNEKVLQVIELDICEPSAEEGVEALLEKTTQENEDVEEFTSIPVDECMETIELDTANTKQNRKTLTFEDKASGSNEVKAGSSHSQPTDIATGTQDVKSKSKFELFLKRRWNFNLNIFGIRKKKRQPKNNEKITL